ncbi:GerAB/ArcD/ProY family transporter [Caproicibacter fermentans]|uniref:Endospore germination permease n=1 Tax=Caproicibacter fermentans TaxID=2576756 RepID=A0A7G8T7I4_9FIRM|nr:endospore germination permease [Caproicibacter fermentans]QNK39575.1 endospore germination permease [Caproicibacter fermentans]
MNKTDISEKQMQSTIALFLMGSSVISSGYTSAKQDTWIVILIAVALMIPLAWVYAGILRLYPGQNFYRNVLRAMGRPVGLTICALYLFYLLLLGGQVLRTFSEFVHLVNMTQTPLVGISTAIVAVTVYTLSNRLYVLTRLGKFVLPFLYFTIILTLLLSFRDMDFSNLRPILQSKPSDFLKGLMSAFTLPYGELVACLPMFGVSGRIEKVFPTMVKGVLLGFGFLFAAVVRNILVLGYYNSVATFPSYECVSVIQLGEFFTRIEVLIGINLLLAGFIKFAVLVFSSCEGVTRLFGYRDSEPFVAPLSLFLLTLSALLDSNTSEVFGFKEIYVILALPFQVVLPILILVVGTVRKKLQKPRKTSPAARKSPSA